MAKNFINILSITEAKTLKLYNNKKTSLFHYNKVEDQIAQLYSNSIELKSGASIVINITEALIAIDINSSKATKERDIEETALTTNIDSAVLIARHIILRDLSGLIVIDFIDMVQPKNIIKVEKKIKEQLQQDKAKIHIGSIGPFGLLEISRQRIRPSIFETSTIPCPHCSGSGRYLKSTTITYLILVDLQNYLEKYKNSRIIQISCSQLIIKYILNNKINEIISVEQQHNVKISFQENNSYIHDYSIEKNPSLVQKHPIKKSSTQQQKKQYEKNKPHQSKNAPEKHIKNNKIEKKKKDNLDVDKKNQSKVKSWWQDFIK